MANTTDISLVSNVIHVTAASDSPIYSNKVAYTKPSARYSFNSLGTILNLRITGGGATDYYSVPIAELRLSGGGAAPASAAAAYTSLAALFPA